MAILFFALPISAATTTTVQFCTATLTGQMLNRPIRIVPSVSKLVATNHTLFASPYILLDLANGCGTTNLLPGPYDCTIQGVSQTFTILVPATNTTLQAADLLVTPATNTFPAGLAAYPANVADARFAPLPTNWPGTTGQGYLTDGTNAYFGALPGGSGGSGSGLSVAAGTNLVASTNGAGTLTTLSVNAAQLTNGFIGPAQATNAANAATNGLAGAMVLRNGGFASNTVAVQFTITPTNVYAGIGGLSGSANSKTWTITGGGTTTGWWPGYNILITNDQYRITDIVDATHFHTLQLIGANNIYTSYTNAPYQIFPNALSVSDLQIVSPPHPALNIDNDGSLFVSGQLNFANSGKIGWDNGTNTFYSLVMARGFGPALEIDSSWQNPIFMIYEAPYNSFELLPNGELSVPNGYTNAHGSLISFYSPLSANSGLNLRGTLSAVPVGAFTSTGTISGAYGSPVWTGSPGAFAGWLPGYRFNVAADNSGYTVAQVISSTSLYSVESAQGTYSSSGFSYSPPVIIVSNAAPSPTTFVSADGSVGVGGAANSGKLELASGSNSWSMSVNSQLDGHRYSLDSAYFQGVVSIYDHAPYDSFQILGDGTISQKQGITNAHGTTLNLLAPVLASAGGSWNGITNTGHFTIGPDVPNTSLVMVGADGHATNVTLSGASLSGTTLTIAGGGGSYLGAFNANQFGSNSGGVYLKSGVTMTNPAVSGGGSLDGSLAFNPTTGSSLFQAGMVVTGGGIISAGFTNSGGHVANPDAGTTALVMQGAGGMQTNVTLAGGLVVSGTTLSAAGVTNGGNLLFTNSSLNPALLAAGGALPALNAGALTNYLPDANSPNLPRTLWRDGMVANSGTSETAVSTNTLPANLLAANGNAIDYWLHGTNNNTGVGRTLTWKVYYGTTSLTIMTSATTTGIAWEIHLSLVRISASVVDLYTWSELGGVVQNVVRATDTGSTASAQPLSVTITSTSQSGDINCRTGRAQYLP